MDNKIICKPKSLSIKALKKFKLVIQVGNGPYGYKMTHTAYGLDKNDALNNDKIKCFGWGCDWKLLKITQVSGTANSRYVKILKRIFDNAL